MHASTPAPSSEESPVDSFERAYQELQQVIQQLQDGGLSLDECVNLYERGVALASQCNRIVDEAELRVRRVTPGGPASPAEPDEPTAF
jgi:exodeoxyribonuclease VII small subunit